jgi:ABC-type glycerol-3-phosphate transport system permease component
MASLGKVAATSRRRRLTRSRAIRGLGRAGLWLWLLFSAVPIVFVVVTSFKSAGVALAIPPRWSFKPTLSNYSTVLTGAGGTPNVGSDIVHGLIITSVVTAGTVVLGTLAGYALTLRSFKARHFLSSWVLSTYMFPPLVGIVPLLIVEGDLGLRSTYPGIMIPEMAFNLPIVVWLVRRGIQEIPLEIEESGMLDGLTRLGLLRKIVTPLAMPSIAASAIITAVLTWNELIFSSVMTGSGTAPASTSVLQFTGMYGTQWGLLCAASVVIAFPPVLLALVARRRFVSGLTFGVIG